MSSASPAAPSSKAIVYQNENIHLNNQTLQETLATRQFCDLDQVEMIGDIYASGIAINHTSVAGSLFSLQGIRAKNSTVVACIAEKDTILTNTIAKAVDVTSGNLKVMWTREQRAIGQESSVTEVNRRQRKVFSPSFDTKSMLEVLNDISECTAPTRKACEHLSASGKITLSKVVVDTLKSGLGLETNLCELMTVRTSSFTKLKDSRIRQLLVLEFDADHKCRIELDEKSAVDGHIIVCPPGFELKPTYTTISIHDIQLAKDQPPAKNVQLIRPILGSNLENCINDIQVTILGGGSIKGDIIFQGCSGKVTVESTLHRGRIIHKVAGSTFVGLENPFSTLSRIQDDLQLAMNDNFDI